MILWPIDVHCEFEKDVIGFILQIFQCTDILWCFIALNIIDLMWYWLFLLVVTQWIVARIRLFLFFLVFHVLCCFSEQSRWGRRTRCITANQQTFVTEESIGVAFFTISTVDALSFIQLTGNTGKTIITQLHTIFSNGGRVSRKTSNDVLNTYTKQRNATDEWWKNILVARKRLSRSLHQHQSK